MTPNADYGTRQPDEFGNVWDWSTTPPKFVRTTRRADFVPAPRWWYAVAIARRGRRRASPNDGSEAS